MKTKNITISEKSHRLAKRLIDGRKGLTTIRAVIEKALETLNEVEDEAE